MRDLHVIVLAAACALAGASSLGGCGARGGARAAQGSTIAELRRVKGLVEVGSPAEAKRAPYPRERLVSGSRVSLGAGGLAWLRRDGGATWLVEGPAELVVGDSDAKLESGRAFVDGQGGAPVVVDTPRGRIELADGRASVEVFADGAVEAYVLRGAARARGAERASAGEKLVLRPGGAVERSAPAVWDDWTGGLATADPSAEAAPFGLGTVGARPPGDKGRPRFSLVVERLDVRVTVDRDLATTEVDQTFVNPSAATVEGIYSFRTAPGAVLQKFGVDRDGELVWGRVKESAAARAQYESQVYAGSSEDPALLSWMAPGAYAARLYPIEPGARRRVVTRYAEWLTRQGPKGDRRVWVYPLAAEGALASLPRIEEMRVTLDVSRAGASRVRTGAGASRDGDVVTLRAFDFVPRADLAVELFDAGEVEGVAYRASHALGGDDAPMNADPTFVARVSADEPDYLLVPVRAAASPEPARGVDLAIVVDTSAATEPSASSIARNLASALLAHLGPDDRAALFAGDASLRPAVEGSGELRGVDAATRRAWLAGLAAVERGGATDVGALLADAAAKLDPKRRGAVVYVGDGVASVGETAPKELRERLARLPRGVRLLAAAVGSRANVSLLDAVAKGAPVEVVSDAYGAARSALRLLEAAERPAWVGASLDLGKGVDRVLPRALPPLGVDEGVLVVGRVVGALPATLALVGDSGTTTLPLRVVPIADGGDLRRRWGQERMGELLAEGAPRAALVELGRRFGLVSPTTSLYVPSAGELARGTEANEPSEGERDALAERRKRWKPWTADGDLGFAKQTSPADEKAGGTGTRAKGEEGSMGASPPNDTGKRYAVQGPQVNDRALPARDQVLGDDAAFGLVGLLNRGAGGDPNAPAAAGGLGLSGTGEGGGGRGEAIGLGSIGLIGHGSGVGALGGASAGRVSPPTVRSSAPKVTGKLPAEVVSRVVRQGYARYKACYEAGLRTNPSLQGSVSVRFTVGADGAVSNVSPAESRLGDASVVGCIVRAFHGLSFPQPEGGVVSVVFPLTFLPGDGPELVATPATSASTPKPAVAVPSGPIASVGHSARPCGSGADVPLDERRTLWSERLGVASNASAALDVYRRALEECEARTWRERTTLLLLMVDRLASVSERVALWKALVGTPAADVIYRAIVVRVASVEDLHELHRALGLATVDADLLAGMLAKAKTPAERASALRAAAARWPDDLELALRVLDAYEDAGDDAGLRAWARRLRHRPDATTHVSTSVGEHYLRLAARESGADAERDVVEARRTFGEIVEFSPEDPGARRRLGDLLRAHGWYDEALRQYLTLKALTPDDASVPLLLAAATRGLGRVEEAVGWAEKAAAVGAPDGEGMLARASRATARAFVAWAWDDATKAARADEAERLLARARRLAPADALGGQTTHVLVTWTHPELHPTLFAMRLGVAAPVPDDYPLFGVAEATLPAGASTLELRVDAEDASRAARLGLAATVTAVTGEGTASQRVSRVDVRFGTREAPVARVALAFEDGALRLGAP